MADQKSRDDIVTRLYQAADLRAKLMTAMAADKTARNRAAGEPDALYLGLKPEETLEWEAAKEIERLRHGLELTSRSIGDGL